MFCSECGTQLSEDVKFCSECGSNQTQITNDDKSLRYNNFEKYSKLKLNLFLGFSLILVVLLVTFFQKYSNSIKLDDKSTFKTSVQKPIKPATILPKTDYWKISSKSLMNKFVMNYDDAKINLVGQKVETAVDIVGYETRGDITKLHDVNSGLTCLMKKSEYNSEKDAGNRIVRGEVTEDNKIVGINNCTFSTSSKDWQPTDDALIVISEFKPEAHPKQAEPKRNVTTNHIKTERKNIDVITLNCVLSDRQMGVGGWQVTIDRINQTGYITFMGDLSAWAGLTSNILDKKLPLESVDNDQGSFYHLGNSGVNFNLLVINKSNLKFRIAQFDTGRTDWGNCVHTPIIQSID